MGTLVGPIEDFDDYKVIGLLKNSLLIESIDFSINTSSYGGARIKANDTIYRKICTNIWVAEKE